MAKPKLSDFKKYLESMDETQVRAEMLKLFGKLSQVQEFYAQELMSGSDRKAMLDEIKKKIYSQFWTRGGNPRNDVSNAAIRKLISDFEKISTFPHEVVDLLIYRVEVATNFASQFGGMPDSDYNAATTAFEKAVKIMSKEKLQDHFKLRCERLFRADNLDYWYIEDLQSVYQGEFS